MRSDNRRRRQTMLKVMNRLFKAAALLIIVLYAGCDPEPPQPENPVFTDVQKIEVSYNGGIFYFSEVPDYVKYMQLLIFSSSPAVDDDSKTIDKSSLIAGSRTYLTGFSRASVNSANIYVYVPADDDFTGLPLAPVDGDYIIVLGFDSDLNLTHASPSYAMTLF